MKKDREDMMLDRIDGKLDKLDGRVNSIDVTLASQHEQLTYHIRRTDLLEHQIKPLENHMTMVQGAMKLIGFIAVIAGIIEGVVTLLDYMKG